MAVLFFPWSIIFLNHHTLNTAKTDSSWKWQFVWLLSDSIPDNGKIACGNFITMRHICPSKVARHQQQPQNDKLSGASLMLGNKIMKSADCTSKCKLTGQHVHSIQRYSIVHCAYKGNWVSRVQLTISGLLKNKNKTNKKKIPVYHYITKHM